MSDKEPIIQTIRTFMAVAIDDAARKELTKTQNAMQRISAGVKWVTPVNIHLSLVFLGDIFENSILLLQDVIDQTTAQHGPCALDIQGLGYFGSPHSPRVIWAGLRGDIRPLTALQEAMITALQTAGVSPDTKPFKPHLTLGRMRSSRQTGDIVKFISSRRDALFGRLDVQSVLLMKSQLPPQGPIYSILHASPLKTT